jgi:GNAT superfamily N-acetyltransferase
MPTTLVAMQGETLLGSVSLVLEDAPELRDQGDAWLASLYVVPEARGLGLGVRLVKELVAFAARQQVDRLWLFTPEHASFYARLGWRPQGSATLRGVPVHLMDILPA